jgi:hypothetical protein
MFAIAQYNDKLAKEYVYAAALAYCPAKDIMNKNCNKATASVEILGMSVLHALDNSNENDPVTYTILKRDEIKEIIIAFSGTVNNHELVHEIAASYPVRYSLQDSREAKVFIFSSIIAKLTSGMMCSIKPRNIKAV